MRYFVAKIRITKIMGIFVNDRADWEQWHLKRSQEAIRKGDMFAAKNHAARAKSYHSAGDNYKRDAQKSTK